MTNAAAQQPTLVVVAGPTAVGKTALSVRLAQALQTDVVSADSRQFYRGLSIGTAKPTPAEMAGVHHHFIDSHDLSDPVSAGRYEREALARLATLFETRNVVVLTGGTGLYIHALCVGLDDVPPAEPGLRERLEAQLATNGLGPLQAQLRRLDPAYAQTADLQNAQRVVRALEVTLSTGQPYSSFWRRQVAPRPFRPLLLALDRPREELYARIDARVDEMLTAGLLEEVRALLPYRHLPVLRTVGYREVFAYFDGAYDYAEMERLLKRNSRRYAKRQLTWFRHQADYRWFHPDQFDALLHYVQAELSASATSRA